MDMGNIGFFGPNQFPYLCCDPVISEPILQQQALLSETVVLDISIVSLKADNFMPGVKQHSPFCFHHLVFTRARCVQIMNL